MCVCVCIYIYIETYIHIHIYFSSIWGSSVWDNGSQIQKSTKSEMEPVFM